MKASVGGGIALLLGLVFLVDASAQTRPVPSSSVPASSVPASPTAQWSASPNAPAASNSAGTPVTTDPAATRNLAATLAVVDNGATIVAPDKTTRVPKVGDKIYEGDAIVTRDGEVHLDMADGGYIAIRPSTAMRIAQYQANGDSEDKSVIGLLKGSFRSITGWIGKTNPKNYAVLTPTATIGVRGTDHEPAYVPEGTPGQDAGTYDNVHAGGTTIANAAGRVDVTPDHAGFVDYRRNVAPRLLEHVPAFFQSPHAHESLFIGKHDKVMASLDQRRTQRIQDHQQELRSRPLSRDTAKPEAGAAAHRPAVGHDAAARQPVTRESAAHEQAAREQATRETAAREQAARGNVGQPARPGLNPALTNRNAAPLNPQGRAGNPFEQMRANMAARRDATVSPQAQPAARAAVVPQRPQPVRPAANDPNKKKENN